MGKTLIRHASIYDGTGQRPFAADLLLEDGVIRRIGTLGTPADAQVINAQGLTLCPGFINTHSHMELELFRDPALPSVVEQGITTEILGQDGSSVAPLHDGIAQELADNMAPLCGVAGKPYWWRSYADYMRAVRKAVPAVRFEGLVGHGTIRMNVMGSENRRPTAGELQKMRALIARCMEEGAKGLSFGLIYPPGSYAETEELTELAKEVAAHDGLVMVHTRNEMGRLVEAFEEMLAVMRQSGVRMHISHLKAMGWQNWESKIHTALGLIEEHQRQGFDLTFDQYPYSATCTGLKVCAPGWAFAGGEEAFQKRLRDPEIYPGILRETQTELTARGGGKNVGIAAVATAEYAWMAGRRLDEVAERLGLEEAEAALHILEHEGPMVVCIYHAVHENDIRAVMRSPYGCVCTDGIVGASPHPRMYGSFVRFLARYVRDQGLMPLEAAIKKITAEPARRLRLWDRGLIREGMSADLALFDYQKLLDLGTYEQPAQLPRGMRRVWVQGQLRVCRDAD